MLSRADGDALMTQIGRMLGLAGVTSFESEQMWTLVVDDDILVFVDYEADPETLRLSAELGAPEESARATLYDTLLQYNHQWRDTGGLQMSLDGPGGDVVLSYPLRCDGLDISRLSLVVGNFIDVARAWRTVVAGAGHSAVDPMSWMPHGMIRG